MDDTGGDQMERISALAEGLRRSGTLGRSALMNRLFDFLLEQSLAGRSPKEVELAQEVFGRDAQFDMAQDASVRVYIHRLRRKLDEAYAGTGGERLTIPRGEYRLALTAPRAEAGEEPDEWQPPAVDPVLPPPPRQRLGWAPWKLVAALGLALAVGIAIGGLAWFPRHASNDPSALANTPFWRPLATSTRQTFVVAGDYYIFGEAPDTMQVTRLVREFYINSREELDEYLMAHPGDYGRYVDLDLHYLPVSTGPALRDLLPPLESFVEGTGRGRPRVITMSRLTPEILKSANIVYVGFLSSLGLLRDPLFEASGFSIGDSYDELIDQATGRHYLSDWEKVAGSRAPRRDFAYLASFPGPVGNRILVVAGTRDAAVMQAAEVAADKAQLDQIAARAGNAAGFEALYEVRTLGALNLGSTLVLARPLKLDGLWQADGTQEIFPDQSPPADAGPARGQASRRRPGSAL